MSKTKSSTTSKNTVINLSLIGTGGNDILNGGAGNDTINGGDGNDILNGGDGNDTINGGAGNDILNGGAGNDTINGGAGNDILNGGDGDDTLIVGRYDGIINGGEGRDAVKFTNSNFAVNVDLGKGSYKAITSFYGYDSGVLTNVEDIIGSNLNDTLIGNASNNTIEGGQGDDTLEGGQGDDTLMGGDGNDKYVYRMGGYGQDIIEESLGNNDILVLYNMTRNEAIFGKEGNDLIVSKKESSSTDRILIKDYFLSNSNTIEKVQFIDANSGVSEFKITDMIVNIYGTSEDDVIYSTTKSSNYINGYDGNDTVSYANFASRVIVSLSDGRSEGIVYIGGSSKTDKLMNIENVIGSSFNDIITGNNGSNVINGGEGNDTVSYHNSDSAVTINLNSTINSPATAKSLPRVVDTLISIENATGSSYGDKITGDNKDNILNGGAGNDTINGGAGNDTLRGGHDNDKYVYELEGYGQDTIEELSGDNDILVLYNMSENEAIFRKEGNDLIVSKVDSSSDNRILIKDYFLSNSNTIEKVQFIDSSSNVREFNINDMVVSMDGAEKNDFIHPIIKNSNHIDEGDVNDAIIGVLGIDNLSGDLGNKVFLFENIEDSSKSVEVDKIYDFEKGQDKTGLKALDIDGSEKLSIDDNSFGTTFFNDDFSAQIFENIYLDSGDFIF